MKVHEVILYMKIQRALKLLTWEKVGPEERIGGVGLLKHDRVRWHGL